MAKTVKETTTEQSIKDEIIRLGGYVIKNQAYGATGKGKPDLSACLYGMYIGLEVKRSKGECETTAAQLTHLIRITKAGGLAYITKTADCLTNSNYDTMNIVESTLENIDEVTHDELKLIMTQINKPDFKWCKLNIIDNKLIYHIYH